jgi:hypothetical protein
MAIVAFPSSLPPPNSMSMGLRANTQSGGRSPFDGTEQSIALPGARWVAELRFNNLTTAQGRVLDGFVAGLNGTAGRFTWAPPFPRRGTAGGSPTVRLPSVGTILSTQGWTADGIGFEAGDFFSVLDPTGRPQLFRVRDAAGTTGAGWCDFFVAPIIRRSPNVNAPLILTNPAAVWRLSEDTVMTDYAPGGFSDIVLNIEEAIW